MAKYELEIVTSKGNKFREGGKTLTETRIKACRFAKKEDAVVNIRKWENYWKQIEYVFYDDRRILEYNDLRKGFYLQKVGKGRRYRVSPKTGELLDVSKTWKYI